MKAKERIARYGLEAYAKMRGLRGKSAAKMVESYKSKTYLPIARHIEPKAPYISRSQRSYWKDVKKLAGARDINVKSSRKLLKGLRTAKNVQVRVIKQGGGFQLIMDGLYEHREKDGEVLEAPYTREEERGHSYMHYVETHYDCYEEALEECIADAIIRLGGTGWILIKVLKETWIRYYGREK